MQDIYVVFRSDTDLGYGRDDSALMKHLGYFTDKVSADLACSTEQSRSDSEGLDWCYVVMQLKPNATEAQKKND